MLVAESFIAEPQPVRGKSGINNNNSARAKDKQSDKKLKAATRKKVRIPDWSMYSCVINVYLHT